MRRKGFSSDKVKTPDVPKAVKGATGKTKRPRGPKTSMNRPLLGILK